MTPEKLIRLKARRVQKVREVLHTMRKMLDKDFETVEGYAAIYDALVQEGLFKQIVKKVIVEVEKKPVTPPNLLENAKNWRAKQKVIQAEKDLETRRRLKIATAKQRKNIFCYHCNKVVPCIKPEVDFRANNRSGKIKILVKSTCPVCNQTAINWGGYIE